MNTLAKLALAATIFASVPFSIYAASPSPAPADAAESAAQMSEGEIRKIDKDAKKITIRHGELKNLDMPSMTMVFRVKDPAMLDNVKAGDKINFVAEKMDGQFTVTQIETKK